MKQFAYIFFLGDFCCQPQVNFVGKVDTSLVSIKLIKPFDRLVPTSLLLMNGSIGVA
jgi:hypothetical protein